MVIEQTVEISADRPFLVEVSLKPEKKGFFRNLFASKFYKNFDAFYGCLKDTDAFKGDSVEIVRTMRDDWDRPWDKNAKA
jgi:hypothetical protein